MKKEHMKNLVELIRRYIGSEKKGVFFVKMLLWYAACTIVVFLLFGTVMSVSVQKNYREQIDQLNERAISQSVSACTTTLRNLYNYYYLEVLESPELTELLLAEKYLADSTMRFKKLRTMLVNYSDMVESCYVINLKNGFVLSTLDTYHSMEDFPDQDILHQLELIRNIPGEYELIPRKTTYEVRGTEYTKQYISIVLKKYQEGYLVVNLDYSAFANMVNYQDCALASRALLISNTGLILADSGESMFGASAEEEEFYIQLKDQNEKEGVFFIRLKDGRKKVRYCKDQLFGISYMILTDEYLFGNNALLFWMIFYAIIAVIINLIMIVVGTCFLYRPINRLNRMFLPDERETEFRTDEFKSLERIFSKMRSDTREYSHFKRKQMLKELLDGKTLQGTLLNKERDLAKEHLNGVLFICVNLYPNESEERTFEDFLMLKFYMGNILQYLLKEDFTMETVDYGNYITCIISRNVSGEMEEEKSGKDYETGREKRLIRALSSMQEKMGELFGVDITCSVGSVVNSLDDISESYEEALVAAFFQMTKEKNAILYNDGLAGTTGEQGYPDDIVKEILDGIKSGDKGKIRKEVFSFFTKLMSVSYHRAMKSALMLEMEIVRLEMKYDIFDEKVNMSFVEGLRGGGRLYKMKEACLEHCLSVAEICAERRDNNSNMSQIVERVKNLVEQKLTDHDLSVNSIAKEIYLSAGYVRIIFKEVTGDTLSNYIISRKLSEICRLLRETDWSVQQIADYMEFSSRSYLYTFFKNYMGMTPNQYRKEKNEDIIPVIPDGKGRDDLF